MSATLLATAAQIWEIAFPQSGDTPAESINDTLIETAQLRYLKPVLGDLYDTLGETRRAAFVSEFLKTPLAYYVRSLALGMMSATVGALGILQGKTDYAAPVAARQVHNLRKEARHQADILLDKAVEHIESNPGLFPEYDPQANIRHRIRIRGGIVLENTPNR